MLKRHELTLEKLISIFFTAFFAMSSLFLLFSQKISFYHVLNIDISMFILQLVITIILILCIFVYHNYINHLSFTGMVISTFLVFAIIFMIKAPVLSLRIGILVMSIPFLFINTKKLIRHRYEKFDIFALNSIIWAILFIIFLITFNHVSIDTVMLNVSQISEASIIPQNGEQYLIYTIPLLLILILLFVFNRFQRENKNLKLEIIFIVSITLIEVVALSIFMIYRTKVLYTSTYDFGIYAQMFYNMKNFNGMITTLERSMPLSHLAVHFSPIYYLMLPIYMIFPYLETLQVLQVAIVSIGVIPLYLIAKSFNLNRTVIVVIITMYLFHPAILSSSFYDLHENCFLGPLLLFVLYFGLKQNYIGLIISAIFTLFVKEDASIYLIFIGLYFLMTNQASTKKASINHFKMSISLIVMPLIYFIVVTSLINTSGDGAMFWRYDNLQAYPDLGIIGIPLTVFQNPSYWLATMFSPEKIYHVMVIFLCLGFIPLFNQRFSYFWLVMPLLIFNLSSMWPYQYLFGYQYYYGSVALLIFLILLAFRDHQIKQSHVKSLTSYGIASIALVTILAIGVGVLMINMKYVNLYKQDQMKYDSMIETLDMIPEDASVVASSYLTPYLSQREILYDMSYYDLETSNITFDYIVLDNWRQHDADDEMITWLNQNNYQPSNISTEQIIIYIPK